MLTNWIVCFAVTAFLLGFIQSMFSPQMHSIISIGTYLIMWCILSVFERRKKAIYSNTPYVTLMFIILIGALSLVALFVPSISEAALLIRAFAFLAALTYFLSSTARMYVDVWFERLRNG